MLSKEEIEKAWQLLGGRGFDSLCAFADDYAIKLLEDHEYLIGEVERLSKCQSCGGVGYVELSHDPYMTSPCECVIFEQVVEDYPKLKLRNQELQKQNKTLVNSTNKLLEYFKTKPIAPDFWSELEEIRNFMKSSKEGEHK